MFHLPVCLTTQCVVICFFNPKNESAFDNNHLVSVYRLEWMSIQMVQRWHISFLKRRMNAHNEPHSEWPSTPPDIQLLLTLLSWYTFSGVQTRHLQQNSCAITYQFPYKSRIVNKLGFKKNCTQWVPHLLCQKHKEKRTAAMHKLLDMFWEKWNLMSRVVTGDKNKFIMPLLKQDDKG